METASITTLVASIIITTYFLLHGRDNHFREYHKSTYKELFSSWLGPRLFHFSRKALYLWHENKFYFGVIVGVLFSIVTLFLMSRLP